MRKRALPQGMAGVGLSVFLVASLVGISAFQLPGEAVRVDNDDLGGVVNGPRGPEAGVWVIAETTDLPTKFARIVVTDDRGRYVVPDLPKATYNVWVRGYGLVDSPKVQAGPGKILNLTAVAAPNARAAAEYYPPSYWYSLAKVPDKSEFPGTGPKGNGISEEMKSQADWLNQMRCGACHHNRHQGHAGDPQESRYVPFLAGSLGTTREVGADGPRHGRHARGVRPAGDGHVRGLDRSHRGGRSARGAAPAAGRGTKRGRELVGLVQRPRICPRHDFDRQAQSDRQRQRSRLQHFEVQPARCQHPRPGAPYGNGCEVPIRDTDTEYTNPQKNLEPSPYWGEEIIWSGQASLHNPMLDHTGRVWLTHAIRATANPAFCKQGSSHPSAQQFPLNTSGRHLSVMDPKTKQVTMIDTCFGTHHLQFAEDANNTLYFSGSGPVLAWFNTKLFDETKDEQKAQGWAAYVIDTNGNGKRDAYVEPNQPTDPTKDKRFQGGSYGVIVSPVDGSVWQSFPGAIYLSEGNLSGPPGAITRTVLGSNPPQTTLTEYYEPPFNNPKSPVNGYTPRGIDIDRNGVVWTALAGSGHLASFDRRKCKGPLNGPTATGQHCPEGWTLHVTPGPKFKGVTDESNTDMLYYNWVDQFDTLGLGRNVPVCHRLVL